MIMQEVRDSWIRGQIDGYRPMNDDGDLDIIVPTEEQWRQAAYLQLKPYDTDLAMQIEGDHRPLRIPLLGTVRHYSVELVFTDSTWKFLYFGTGLAAARQMIRILAACHDRPIMYLVPKHSDVEGYCCGMLQKAAPRA
jgi:hypothetical protein